MKILDKLDLIAQLDRYGAKYYCDISLCLEMEEFILNSQDPFDKNDPNGHITAGGLVVCGDYVLLNYHKKLNKLIGFGGHAEDDEEKPFEIAVREIREETGIQKFKVQNLIFDLSKFTFKHDSKMPSHIHYDFRYLFEVSQKNFVKSSESDSLVWLKIADALKVVTDPATKRMIEKYNTILNEKNSCDTFEK